MPLLAVASRTVASSTAAPPAAATPAPAAGYSVRSLYSAVHAEKNAASCVSSRSTATRAAGAPAAAASAADGTCSSMSCVSAKHALRIKTALRRPLMVPLAMMATSAATPPAAATVFPEAGRAMFKEASSMAATACVPRDAPLSSLISTATFSTLSSVAATGLWLCTRSWRALQARPHASSVPSRATRSNAEQPSAAWRSAAHAVCLVSSFSSTMHACASACISRQSTTGRTAATAPARTSAAAEAGWPSSNARRAQQAL
mmetsp:Transcript_19852/g.70236  ORF Transcript_19852/g.70236 Transcript_19852/m.70236 type:complete len:260 (+) Transcript_19852:626-1405(+)